MKQPSGAGGGKPAKPRHRKPSRLKRKLVPKAVAHRNAATDRMVEWLEKFDLGQYAQNFAENDISFAVLPDLTDQDLKDIGVSLGHRRQLLREIANLDKTAVASPSAPSLTAPSIAAASAKRSKIFAKHLARSYECRRSRKWLGQV